MAIDYEIKDAFITEIKPNFDNFKLAFIAKDLNFNEYIFKPSWENHYHNINEFISHYIAKLIDAPVTDGIFLKIDPGNMEEYHEKIKMAFSHMILPTYIPPYDDAIFFATKYLKLSTSAKTINHLENSLIGTSNKDGYFSQFPLDQYLKNPDRHLGNHIFYKEQHKKNFYLIDFDRIFHGPTDWSKLSHNINNTDCFTKSGYNADLYPTVTDEDIKIVHDFATKIEKKITDKEIQNICDIIIEVYGTSKQYLDKIEAWLKHRRDLIYSACLKNEPCYENVKQEGVFKC
jgi:hypothetical protein